MVKRAGRKQISLPAMSADPHLFYTDKTRELETGHRRLLKKRRQLAWARLSCIAALIGTWYFFSGNWYIVLPVVLILLVVFRWLILRDIENREDIAHNRQLHKIVADEIRSLHHSFDQFEDGKAHLQSDHFYANDLDIFGPASLFQFTNRTVSEMGSAQLASWLLHPASTEEIGLRQKAVAELSDKIDEWQELQAFGKSSSISIGGYQRLKRWMQSPQVFTSPVLQWIRWILPLISVSVTIATIAGFFSTNIFYSTMLMMFIVAGWLEKNIKGIHDQLGKMVGELDTLSKSVAQIENMHFESEMLRQLQSSYNQGSHQASRNIRALKKILDRLDLRLNIVLAVPLNLLFLWNFQQTLALEKWKNQHDADIDQWFFNLGILEAIGSFAVMKFNHPAFVFPAINPQHFQIHASQMGHPLIAADKRVDNNIDIDPGEFIMLITGSNMAGKSTYLRTVGVNTVLAMAGAPVCAKSFSISNIQLLSSMRIADNLQESTSTFYAELKKLKAIIEKVNAGEKVFILLDEILRGTNSLDRHAGSEALIKQLIKQKATALIATHDLGLAELEKEFPQALENFHFDVQVNGEELFFDYQLKPGICTSMNASILMKKIGIELEG
jgi:hypothetical protein